MKQRILEAGIQLIDENGFKSTSINDIVEAIGVTKGTFYYYFASKEELLKDIHILYIEDLIHRQEEILANTSTTCTNKLYEIIHLLISNIRTKRQSARIFIREIRHLSKANFVSIRQKRNMFRDNIQSLLEDGIYKGEFKPGSRADIVTLGILGMTNWSFYWFNPFGLVSEEELSKIYVEMILSGIKS
jgi:AcrR family transcriptional regulator